MGVSYASGRVIMTADNDASAVERYNVKGVNFVAANGQGLVLQDQDDKDIIRLEAETGNLAPTVIFPTAIPVTQLKAETLDGGQVIVYI